MGRMDVASASSSLRFGKDSSSARKKRIVFRSYSDADARPNFSMTMRLKMVLGMTYPAGNCITVHPESGTCAYTASNAVVLFDTINARQIGYMKESKKPLGTIRFSEDGRYIVTGGSGHMPPVCVWDVAHRMCVAMMYGHEFGIKCVSFSPKMDIIVSIGNIYDGFIYIWGWPHRERLAANRFAEEIIDLAFSSDSSFFVTCGVHHIKFWYPQPIERDRNGKRRYMITDSVLYGRPAVLGNIKMSNFLGVVCGTQRTAGFVYIINSTGHVGLLSSGMRDIIKLKSLGKKQLSSISVKDDTLIVAARDGNVFFCNALSLEVISCLSPKAVHGEAFSNSTGLLGNNSRMNTYICYDQIHKILSVFSTGGKLTIWNVQDPHNIVKMLYIYNHCGGITGSDLLPLKSRSSKKREVLVTVAADATIRLWGLDVTKTVCCDGVTIMSTDLASPVDDNIDFSIYNSEETIQGDLLTACKMCDDFIATGDNQGNVVAYNMSDLQVVASVKHHIRAVSCVEIFTSETSNHKYLLSGGRDRKIIMYDLNDKLKILSATHLHSGTITVLRVFEREGRIFLVSCGLDRSMVLSASSQHLLPTFSVCYNRCLASSIMDCVFHQRENTLGFGTVSGDINVFSMDTFNPVRIFRSSNNINIRVDKIALDAKNNLLLAACSDRTISAINYLDGKILAITSSHNVSGLFFSINNRCFISTSTDGCIFVWGLSNRTPNKPLMKSSSLELRSFASKKNLSSSCMSKASSLMHL